jgi:DNA polymerase III subunit delta
MTVVPNSRADRFVARPHEEIMFFLVHGSDEGLVNERAKGVLAATNPGSSHRVPPTRLDGDDIARQPSLLWDEAYALSLFGERRSIWVDAQARDFSSAFEPLFARPPKDCAIVVRAGVLKRGTSLRSIFEGAVNAASLECYADSDETLDALIDQEVCASRMTLSGQAREELLELLGTDRQTTRNEIAKLMLYAHGCTEISLDKVTAILGDGRLSTVDNLVDQTLRGERSSVAVSAVRVFGPGVENELLAPRLATRLISLYRLRLEMEQGVSFESAQKSSGVRLPMSVAKTLGEQAKHWNSSAISQQLSALRSFSARARSDVALSRLVMIRALWAIASQARRARH